MRCEISRPSPSPSVAARVGAAFATTSPAEISDLPPDDRSAPAPSRATWPKALLVGAAILLSAPPPVSADTVVAARTLRPGAVLSAEDLALKNGAVTPGAVQTIEEAIGQEAQVALYQGRPIRAVDLAAPTLVRRNDIVALTFSLGGLALRTEGRALDSGRLGDRVRIMNLDSRMVVFGAVAGPSWVETR